MACEKQLVLLVEDDDDAREALAAVLALRDVEVDAASDGSQALVFARQKSYSAVLVDLSIPEPDGYAIARHLKSQSRPPILIAVTGRSEAQQTAFEAGFDHFVVKPVDLEYLVRLLAGARGQTSD